MDGPHRRRRLELIDRCRVDDLPATSASRTIIDLAATASIAELERAIDSAVRDGLTSAGCSSPASWSGSGPSARRGVVLLDELLVDSGGHSDLERRFLALVRRAGLPRPTCQRVFRRDGTTLARVDFSFEPRPVIVEVSGRRGHSSDAERARDAQRRNELQHLGRSWSSSSPNPDHATSACRSGRAIAPRRRVDARPEPRAAIGADRRSAAVGSGGGVRWRRRGRAGRP